MSDSMVSERAASNMFISAIKAQELAHENYILYKLKSVVTDKFTEEQKREILSMQYGGIPCSKIAQRMETTPLVVTRLINRTSWPGPRQSG